MNSKVEQEEKGSADLSIDRANRVRVRKQLWLVLLGLLLVAIAYTQWQWYLGEFVVGNQPVPWRKAEWSVVEQELERGRRTAVFVADSNDEAANEELLKRFETEQIRKQLFYGQRLPLKLQMPDDQKLREQICEELKIESTPCCLITRGKEPALILSGQVTSEEITVKIEN